MQPFYLIMNPRAGRRQSRSILQQVRPILQQHGRPLEVVETEFAGHARQLLQDLPLPRYRGIIVMGGDGTLHEVVQGLMSRAESTQIPLGLIPTGSGNSLAMDLGLIDPGRAADVIVASQTRWIDLAEVSTGDQTLFAFNIIGWGLATDVGVRAERWRRLGPSRYTLASLAEVIGGARLRKATLFLDDREIQDEFLIVVACNTRHSGNMLIAPPARLDDGLIDVISVRGPMRRGPLVGLLRQIYSGGHIQHPRVQHDTVTRIRLESQTEGLLNIDGQLTGAAPFQIEMRPRALEILARPDEA